MQDADKNRKWSEANLKGWLGSTRSERTKVLAGQDKQTGQTLGK